HLLNRRHQQCDQDAQDGEDNEQFDESEPGTTLLTSHDCRYLGRFGECQCCAALATLTFVSDLTRHVLESSATSGAGKMQRLLLYRRPRFHKPNDGAEDAESHYRQNNNRRGVHGGSQITTPRSGGQAFVIWRATIAAHRLLLAEVLAGYSPL